MNEFATMGEDDDAMTESLVRTALEQQASSLAPESPPLDQLRARGRRRRRVQDALTGLGTLALVGGVALGVHSVSGEGSAQTAVAAASPTASVKPSWAPGPRLQVPTYTSVPSWMQKTSAAAELSGQAAKHHDVVQADAPYLGCVSLGSSPLLWPEGFYAEGKPLTIFDPHGRAVYVLDKGFTGADGSPQLGWGNGQLSSGYSLTGCPDDLQAVGSFSLLIIFSGA